MHQVVPPSPSRLSHASWSSGSSLISSTARIFSRSTQPVPSMPCTTIFDIGCGNGIPVTQALATQHRVMGVDLSAHQLILARQNVPTATFLQADVMTLDVPPATFDVVVAFYTLLHVPRQEQAQLLQ